MALIVNEDLIIPSHELKFSFSRSSGPGGQNVNKVNSKAQLRWNPAANQSLPEAVKIRFLSRFHSKLTVDGEILLVSDESRNQKQNQEICLEKLRLLLLQVARPPKVRKKTKPSRANKERRKEAKRKTGEKKRTRSPVRWE